METLLLQDDAREVETSTARLSRADIPAAGGFSRENLWSTLGYHGGLRYMYIYIYKNTYITGGYFQYLEMCMYIYIYIYINTHVCIY